jgi:hypothetical protein
MAHPVHVIDVAHPPRHPDHVEEELMDAWLHVRGSSSLRILKVVNGYGSSGRGGSTREVVRNWAYRNRSRFVAVIPGEEYTLFHDATARLRKEVGDFPDPDLGTSNGGLTIIHVK